MQIMETPTQSRILVVDDFPENILRITGAIQHLDTKIHTTTSSREAYELTQKYDFALLILDVHMPEMNGFELASLIHKGNRNVFTPIIFISAVYFDDHSIFRGYKTGAVDYIVKPVNLEILESKVKVFLQLEKSRIELAIAKEEAIKAKEEKMLFLAKISHEIRNPLSAIIGIIDLMDANELNPEWTERMEMIGFSANHMHNLLNDLLDLSKMESFALKIVHEPLHLRAELEQVIKANKILCKSQSNTVEIEIDPSIPEIILGDSLRYKQILLNLIGNANKFTTNGLIQVKVEIIENTSHYCLIKTCVHDNGIGIAEDEQGDLFRPFSQLNQNITKKYGGSGLGLVVAKNLAQLLGGTLDFMSKPEQGTQFWFTAKFSKQA
ncbi:MAG TPA: hybrid sensor histidine kinase/response regulator [Bacteroidales bacterium]|nr:hybrid sensor histidine kinase/response regulator [Bacteroidales bacterium]